MNAFASDLSHQVLEKRRRSGELAPPVFDETYRRMQAPVGSARERIVIERLTGAAEPLRGEFSDESRGARRHV